VLARGQQRLRLLQLSSSVVFLHAHGTQVPGLQEAKILCARASQSGGSSRTIDGGGLGISPQLFAIGALAQPHMWEAFKPERSGVAAGSATPQPLSPSMPASTISKLPAKTTPSFFSVLFHVCPEPVLEK
jgi:hypothetical protein